MAEQENTVTLPVNHNHLAEAIKYTLYDRDETARKQYQGDDPNKTGYNSLRYIDWTNADEVKRITEAFETAFKKVQFPWVKAAVTGEEGNTTYKISDAKVDLASIQPGMIMVLSAPAGCKIVNGYYLVTSYKDGQFDTFPKIENKFHRARFNNTLSTDGRARVLVPAYNNIPESTEEAVRQIATETIPNIDESYEDNNRQTFGPFNYTLYEDDTYLQIGDVVTSVDPTQISFSTSNGYNYFPTIRTQGNPKVPTLQQVKNINLTMIFPNEDSINYQLLNIFAMFRRTPFVTVRNREVSEFFKAIAIDEYYVPVALESINIQSIEGFPNTVQAQISMLPFDPRVMSDGLRALRSMGDVLAQQSLVYRDRRLQHLIEKSDQSLNENGVISSRFSEIVNVPIDSSANFKESVPFRSFYQALIEERNYIKDEFGKDAITDKSNRIDLTPFRPTKDENYLHHYRAEANQIPLSFSYRYIDGDFTDTTKLVAKARTQIEINKVNELRTILKLITGPEQLLTTTMATFYDTGDFYRKYNYKFGELDNVVRSYLARHGITVEGTPAPEITTFFQFLGKTLNPFNGIDHILSGVRQAKEAIENSATRNNTSDVIGEISNLVWEEALDDKIQTGGATSTVNEAINSIWNWMQSDETKKSKFIAFLDDMARRMRREITGITSARDGDPYDADTNQAYGDFGVIFDPGSNDYLITRLPLKEEKVTIDNINDVVTGWNLNFSNKFTPIHISAYKYPFYQHMGSDDINMSLSITSASRGKDLKAQLSLLSDRLYDTVKLVQLTAPELIPMLDPRIVMTTDGGTLLPDGNIFRVFGVQNVVYNSSNSTNIQNQPDAWNTVLSLTQANFSIQDYHAIESVDSGLSMRDEIAKLLLQIQKNEQGDFVVYRYKSYNLESLPENIRSYLSSEKEGDAAKAKLYIDSKKDDLEYHEITDVETLNTITYLFTHQAKKLSDYIEKIKTRAVPLALQDLKNERAKLQGQIGSSEIGASIAASRGFTVDPSTREDYQQWKARVAEIDKYIASINKGEAEINTSTRVTGENSANRHVELEAYQDQVTKLFNGTVIREIDRQKTAVLKELMRDYPSFGRVIKYNYNIVEELYDQQTNGMMQLININEKFWETFYKQQTLRFGPLLTGALAGVGIGLIVLVGIGATVTVATLGWLLIAAFGITFIGSTLLGLGDAAKEKALDTLRNQFSEFFESILQSIRQSTVTDLASKIYKDPIILNKFLAGGFLPSSVEDFIRAGIYRNVTNCYNDFDFRPFVSANQRGQDFDSDQLIRLTPDFYLYNYRLDDAEILNYHEEALERYINIGKLSTMAGIVDTAAAMQRFKDIEENLGSARISNPIHQKVADLVYHKGDYASSMEEVLTWYKTSVFLDSSDKWKNEAAKQGFEKKLNAEQIKDSLDEFDRIHPFPEGVGLPFVEGSGSPAQQRWREMRRAYQSVLESKRNNVVLDKDQFKLNILYAARAKALIELYTIYTSINNYLLSVESRRNDVNSNAGRDSTQDKKDKDALDAKSLFYRSSVEIKDLFLDIETLLKNAEKDLIKSGEADDFYNKKIKPNVGKGGAINSKKKVSLPDVVVLKNYMYDKMATYMRLNHAVREINGDTSKVNQTINSLPSLRFLQYWNYRERESTVHRIETLNDFIESYTRKVDGTLKMFPTFKIYFIEEDKGVFNQLDDFYTYNAIQSIEITSNKNRASTVARVRLSNITGTLTDRMNLMREQSDRLFLTSQTQKDNVFLGTLDVKPGTSIMIKLGYASNDRDLPTTFIGRIIEMNVGPQVEIIAQSYSAQLNHELLHEKFGMWGTVKGHGDVASAVLDTIPGLEKMGKTDAFSVAQGFSGKNIRKSKGNFGDRFLLSNLLGSISAIAFAQDNPRDDNIYLPYDLVDNPLNRPEFDWVVYDQSVWEVLQELSLYNRNTRPMVRLYNDDPLSTKSDARQTLVVGEKGGYYKYTDSFSFSSKDYQFIEGKVDQFMKIITDIKDRDDLTTFAIELNKIKNNTSQEKITEVANKIFSSTFYRDLYEFFCDKTGVLVAVLHVLRNTEFKSDSAAGDLFTLLGTNIEGFSKEQTIASAFLKMTDLCAISDLGHLDKMNMSKMYTFGDVVFKLSELVNKDGLPSTAVKEDFYIINPLVKNTDESLAYKPNYKKIQTHHLISDDTDIISNNVALSSTFANAVNLYFPDSPIAANANGLSEKQAKNLNVFRIKALGDTKDEHIRPLNSFQKNIDTSWYEVNRQIEGFFKGFQKFKDTTSNAKKAKAWVTGQAEAQEFDPNSINLDTLPAFWVVAVSLLQREVEKMYQGTIEIVGDPNIKPFDVLHINDNMNDMHGAVEVEEVTHVFTPEGGYRTLIVPNMLCYDRSPVQAQDISVINNIYDFAKSARNANRAALAIGSSAASLAGIASLLSAGPAGLIPAAGFGITAATLLWNSTVGVENKYRKFLYDQFGNIMGRDCVNFTSLIYHNAPYIAGFDGTDYTSLTTLINYKVAEISSPIARFAAFTDPFAAVVSTNWNPEQFGLIDIVQNYLASQTTPGIPLATTGISTSSDYNLGMFSFQNQGIMDLFY